MAINKLRFDSRICFYLSSAKKYRTMNKIIVKQYKKLIKNKFLDKLEIYFLLSKLDDKFTISDYLKLIK